MVQGLVMTFLILFVCVVARPMLQLTLGPSVKAWLVHLRAVLPRPRMPRIRLRKQQAQEAGTLGKLIEFELESDPGVLIVAEVLEVNLQKEDGMTHKLKFYSGAEEEDEWVCLDETNFLLYDNDGNRDVPYRIRTEPPPVDSVDEELRNTALASDTLNDAVNAEPGSLLGKTIEFELEGTPFSAVIIDCNEEAEASKTGNTHKLRFVTGVEGEEEWVFIDEENLLLADNDGHENVPYRITHDPSAAETEKPKHQRPAPMALSDESLEIRDASDGEDIPGRVPDPGTSRAGTTQNKTTPSSPSSSLRKSPTSWLSRGASRKIDEEENWAYDPTAYTQAAVQALGQPQPRAFSVMQRRNMHVPQGKLPLGP